MVSLFSLVQLSGVNSLRETKVFGFRGKYGCSIVEVWLILTQVSTAEFQGHQREEVKWRR